MDSFSPRDEEREEETLRIMSAKVAISSWLD